MLTKHVHSIPIRPLFLSLCFPNSSNPCTNSFSFRNRTRIELREKKEKFDFSEFLWPNEIVCCVSSFHNFPLSIKGEKTRLKNGKTQNSKIIWIFSQSVHFFFNIFLVNLNVSFFFRFVLLCYQSSIYRSTVIIINVMKITGYKTYLFVRKLQNKWIFH